MLGIFKSITKPQEESEKKEETTEQKVEVTYKNVIQDPEFKKMEDKFVKKGFTKRGIRELTRVTSLVYKNKKESIKSAESILLGLRGEDGLSKVLGTLKLATEGLGALLKGRKKKDEDS